MSDTTENRGPVSAGGALAGALVGSYLVDVGGLVRTWSHVRFEPSFPLVLALAAGTIGVLSLYRADLSGLVSRVESAFGVDVETTIHITARYVLLLAACLFLLSHTRFDVERHVDLTAAFYLTLAIVAVSVLLRDDDRSLLATKLGAVLASVLVLLSRFTNAVDAFVTAEVYATAVVLVGLVLWNHDGARSRPTADRTVVGVSAYALTLAGVTALAAVVFSYRLGELHFQGDEYLVVDTAASYYFTGELYRWDWIAADQGSRYYDRAWPHTLLVAGSYAVFGVSEWSARIVSVAFGVLTVPLAYVVVEYFTEHRPAAITTAFAIAIYPGLIFYFRWARMYALVVPLVLLLAYLLYRSVTESNPVDVRYDRLDAAIDRYADFNLALGAITLPVLYVAYQVHYNTLVVVAVTYVYVVYRAMVTGERKYYTATVVGLAGLVGIALVARYTPHLAFLEQFVSFFGRENTVYAEYLLRYPFGWVFGTGLLAAGLVIPFRLAEGDLRHKLVYLYVLCTFSFVFYAYVGDRYASYAYVVHVVPFAIALVVYAYLKFVDTIRFPVFRYVLIGLLLVSLVVPLYAGTHGHDYRSLYYEDDQDFETAYGTIVEDFDSDEEVLFAQYPRDYYLRELPADTELISMLNNQRYEPEQFHRDLERHESGWVTWETGKSYHIHPEVRAYVDEHFEQHHGSGVDDTGVEVYYFDETMVD